MAIYLYRCGAIRRSSTGEGGHYRETRMETKQCERNFNSTKIQQVHIGEEGDEQTGCTPCCKQQHHTQDTALQQGKSSGDTQLRTDDHPPTFGVIFFFFWCQVSSDPASTYTHTRVCPRVTGRPTTGLPP